MSQNRLFNNHWRGTIFATTAMTCLVHPGRMLWLIPHIQTTVDKNSTKVANYVPTPYVWNLLNTTPVKMYKQLGAIATHKFVGLCGWRFVIKHVRSLLSCATGWNGLNICFGVLANKTRLVYKGHQLHFGGTFNTFCIPKWKVFLRRNML
jgi:hypothetical protein